MMGTRVTDKKAKEQLNDESRRLTRTSGRKVFVRRPGLVESGVTRVRSGPLRQSLPLSLAVAPPRPP